MPIICLTSSGWQYLTDVTPLVGARPRPRPNRLQHALLLPSVITLNSHVALLHAGRKYDACNFVK